jgi:hypothetical protein
MGGGGGGVGVGGQGGVGGGGQWKVYKEKITKEKRKALDAKSAETQHRHPRGKSPHISRPAPKKVPKKPTRCKGNKTLCSAQKQKKNLVVFFGTCLGAARDLVTT